ncbi:MAG: DUF1214 domain-containing protein [Roseiarcus sp.]
MPNGALKGGLVAGVLAMHASAAVAAQRVDPTIYVRAESDYFMRQRVDAGMFGHFKCVKQPGSADDQIVVRMNRDVLFCWAILDLTQPATVTLPDPGKRYMSMRVINEDHYIKLLTYKPGEYVIDRKLNGTRYAHLAVRFFVDPADAKDLAAANALQDQVRVTQSDKGKFEAPDWDETSRATVRNALNMMAGTLKNSDKMFGDEGEVDPVLHMIGTAVGWGGGPESDSTFLGFFPAKNDGKTAYTLTVPGSVPVDGFWSVTVYTKDGYFKKNDRDLYSRNSATSTPNPDGSTTIRFGGDPDAPNYLPIFPGWNYTVRFYRPRAEIIDKSWTFPAAVEANP